MAAKKGDWVFLTNHALVLVQVWQEPDLTIRSIAERVGITERATHRILGALVESGYIKRKRIGRRNHYAVAEERNLRHPLSSHAQVGTLLKAIKNHASA
jgi:DNA-binding MarR family transcriptional regulator